MTKQITIIQLSIFSSEKILEAKLTLKSQKDIDINNADIIIKRPPVPNNLPVYFLPYVSNFAPLVWIAASIPKSERFSEVDIVCCIKLKEPRFSGPKILANITRLKIFTNLEKMLEIKSHPLLLTKFLKDTNQYLKAMNFFHWSVSFNNSIALDLLLFLRAHLIAFD